MQYGKNNTAKILTVNNKRDNLFATALSEGGDMNFIVRTGSQDANWVAKLEGIHDWVSIRNVTGTNGSELKLFLKPNIDDTGIPREASINVSYDGDRDGVADVSTSSIAVPKPVKVTLRQQEGQFDISANWEASASGRLYLLHYAGASTSISVIIPPETSASFYTVESTFDISLGGVVGGATSSPSKKITLSTGAQKTFDFIAGSAVSELPVPDIPKYGTVKLYLSDAQGNELAEKKAYSIPIELQSKNVLAEPMFHGKRLPDGTTYDSPIINKPYQGCVRIDLGDDWLYIDDRNFGEYVPSRKDFPIAGHGGVWKGRLNHYDAAISALSMNANEQVMEGWRLLLEKEYEEMKKNFLLFGDGYTGSLYTWSDHVYKRGVRICVRWDRQPHWLGTFSKLFKVPLFIDLRLDLSNPTKLTPSLGLLNTDFFAMRPVYRIAKNKVVD